MEHHLDAHVGPEPDSLLFPAAADSQRHMQPSTLYKVYYPAREMAGRKDLRWQSARSGPSRGREFPVPGSHVESETVP